MQVSDAIAVDAAPAVLHDAFISYSRTDKAFGSRLERALEGYFVPKALQAGGRRLNVFRDEQDFTGTEYYQAINKHLAASRTLIVLCSPHARASRYVNEEIRLFASVRGSAQIVPVLISGLPNNEAGPDQSSLLAFPDALLEQMRMPLAVDYRGHDRRKRIDRAPYEGPWFSLLANLLNVSRDEIEQREKKRQAKVRNYWIGGLASVSTALAALSGWALVERSTAARQRDDALRSQSIFLAQLSQEQTRLGRHDLGIKLALQALPRRIDRPDRPWTHAAEAALYSAFAQQTFRFVFGGPRAGFGDKLLKARISPDGLRAILDYGTHAELWNLQAGELIVDLRSDNDHSSVADIGFSPDSRLAAVSYTTHGTVVYGGYFAAEPGQQTVRGSLFTIADASTGTVAKQFQVHGHEKNHLRFSPSGKSVLVTTDEAFYLLNTADWNAVFGGPWPKDGPPLAPPYSTVTFSPDDNRFAFVTENGGTIALGNVAEQSFGAIAQFDGGVAGARFLGADGKMMAAASGPRVVVLSTSDDGHFQLPVTGSSPILALGTTNGGSKVVAIAKDGRALTWEGTAERTIIDARREGAELRSAHLDPAGSGAIVEFGDGEIEFWSLSDRSRQSILGADAERQLLSAAFSSDGNRALLATNDSAARLWDRTMLGPVDQHALSQDPPAVATAFRPSTHHVAIADRDGGVRIQDGASGQQIWSGEQKHQGAIHCVAFDAAGGRLVSGGADHTALVWDVAGGKAPVKLEGHTQDVDYCGFAPTGKLLITGSRDSTFRLWNPESGKVRHVFAVPEDYLDPIHNASINAQAAFTSDGKVVVTVTSGDGYVITQPALVWDVESGALLQALSHPQAAIWHIAITPDDKHVVTTSYDGSAALWDIASGRRLQTFFGHASRILKAAFADRGGLLVTMSDDGQVRVSRLSTGQLVHRWTVEPGLFNMELSHDGRLLALGSNRQGQAAIELWDPVLGVKLAEIGLPGVSLSPLNGLAFSFDDTVLMTRTRDGALSTWRLPPTGQALIDRAWERVAPPGQELLTQEQRIRFALATPDR
jgi:WD40 repeat protein